MAHLRDRHILSSLDHLARFSPLVGILGHRQVGKTTTLSNWGNDYYTFDQMQLQGQASEHPMSFLKSTKARRTILDECQMVPNLFPALKEHVRKHPKPGQFILTGSVRFTSRKAIQESLTGRIMNLELLPMSIAELDQQPLPDVSLRLLKRATFDGSLETYVVDSVTLKHLRKLVQQYLVQGGLPGLCFIRERKLFQDKLNEQLRTILDRDLRQIRSTTLSGDQLMEFLVTLARMQGEPISYEAIRKFTGISKNTQHHLLYALESIFLIRRIPIDGDRSGEVILLEDQGESNALAPELPVELQMVHLLYRNLRTEFAYRVGESARFFQYRTRAGVVVPLAVESNGSVLGWMWSATSTPSRKLISQANSFLKRYQNSKVIFVHPEAKLVPVAPRILSLPLEAHLI